MMLWRIIVKHKILKVPKHQRHFQLHLLPIAQNVRSGEFAVPEVIKLSQKRPAHGPDIEVEAVEETRSSRKKSAAPPPSTTAKSGHLVLSGTSTP